VCSTFVMRVYKEEMWQGVVIDLFTVYYANGERSKSSLIYTRNRGGEVNALDAG
jgi:hypothetical protein